MNSPTHRTCRHCRQRFIPDYRNVYHQSFCSNPECQRMSKRTSQRRWLRKPQNRNYFREPDNASRVREWRHAHPGYWRAHRHSCLPRPPDHNTPQESPPLQDFCQLKASILSALVSRLSRYALQEDIARCATQVVSEAQCILVRCQLNNSPPLQPAEPVNYHETG
jgi:hypothetical protein